jgi:hypothetical protein
MRRLLAAALSELPRAVLSVRARLVAWPAFRYDSLIKKIVDTPSRSQELLAAVHGEFRHRW